MDEDILKRVASRVLKEAGRIDSLESDFSEVKEESSRTVNGMETRLGEMLKEFDNLKERLQSVEGQLVESQGDGISDLANAADVAVLNREIETLRAQNEEFVQRNAVLQATVEQLKKEKADLTESTGDISRFRAETNVGSATVVPREGSRGAYCLYNDIVPIIISYRRDIKNLEAELQKKKGRAKVPAADDGSPSAFS